MNPCRCGHATEPGYRLPPPGPNDRCIAQYASRISGPLLDRIDLAIEVPAVTAADLILPPPAEGSAEVGARVARAREIATRRYAALGVDGVTSNAACPSSDPGGRRPAGFADGLRLILREAADAMRLSARGFHRVLKVARTLADLDGAPRVGRIHLAEAISYRMAADRRTVVA